MARVISDKTYDHVRFMLIGADMVGTAAELEAGSIEVEMQDGKWETDQGLTEVWARRKKEGHENALGDQ